MTKLAFAGTGGHDVVGYEYLGLGAAAVVDYIVPDVQLDFSVAANGARNVAGVYPGMDRFGRNAMQSWVDGALKAHDTSSAVPNIPPIFQERYDYDRAGNRTVRKDTRPGASWAGGVDRSTSSPSPGAVVEPFSLLSLSSPSPGSATLSNLLPARTPLLSTNRGRAQSRPATAPGWQQCGEGV